jgi:hypothetical protein
MPASAESIRAYAHDVAPITPLAWRCGLEVAMRWSARRLDRGRGGPVLSAVNLGE